MIEIAPSILAADFSRLGDEVRAAEAGGAHRVHIDVMDGHFVPNLSMGPVVVKALRPVTRLPLEVHLMVEQPERFVDAFAKEGADILIVHCEVLNDPRPLLQRIRGLGKKAGLAVNPATPVERLQPYLGEIDLALCMTVHPGFAGQPFIKDSPGRVRKLRELIDEQHARCDLEVDGGIDERTAPLTVAAGANVLVAGYGIFKHPQGPAAAVRLLAQLAKPAGESSSLRG